MKILAVVMSAILCVGGFIGFWIGFFVVCISDDGVFSELPIWGMQVPGPVLVLPGLVCLCVGGIMFMWLDRPVYRDDPRAHPVKK